MSSESSFFLEKILTVKEVSELKADKKAYQQALKAYDEAYIQSVDIVPIKDKRFVVDKSERPKLPTGWQNTLSSLADNEELENPIFISVDEKGVLLVQ
ncbi:hypothetical protein PP175_25375 (plasmid) [Aneurinibacillus sp. Ricciae_BoGa-3]|uniref:hypothetical protein n=1 Tax=Aneurinibacillus sp. Ricciae_BoGa-3 TaxID=3022697 RepID=UPI002341AC8C|nr:hypothetical protein [Aneurinibacillus sp. Ricciae_BoGa-3]WCK57401.1 hypothetical protein PP175_25375 [Aneurinibacillus sp. Ricciae_BoGa-3]